jgi:2-haloacid dehalogenase
VDHALRPKLLEAYLSLDAYGDAEATLAALKARGFSTAILSNGSPRMLNAAIQASRMAGLLDALLSVDAVHAYKPRPEVYALVTERFRIRPDEVVFVSSNRWDVMGAAAFGFRPLWVNRTGMPDEYAAQPPLQVVPDLSIVPPLGV